MTELDHFALQDLRVTRRYFAKFEAITGHLARVAALLQAERRLDREEVAILARYIAGLTYSFRALGWKYLFAGRSARAGRLTLDRTESGFPVFSELMTLANDAAQAKGHLAGMDSTEGLKRRMVEAILSQHRVPTELQFALSQRLYYEELERGQLFWARNDAEAQWLGTTEDGRRRFRIHWAAYDSQVNLPQIYLMEIEDSGRIPLPKDDRRWPELRAHLAAQAVAGLKLLTIARGIDEDFDDLHPKRLRRFHIGPMYSSAFTRQSGPLHDVLEAARAPEGEDWALAWTEEDLRSERVDQAKSGWFGKVDREIFALDPFAGGLSDPGASRVERRVILPQRVVQALVEAAPAGFADVVKHVVSPGGRVLTMR
ncbi:MAG: hypothetical protein CSA72_04220 [Rhodobacterales bacterium]|nr:MAG: hypothetical protein CSA72_04220 [Rhodobacterales bacterium]